MSDLELPAPGDIVSSVAFSPVDPKALITAGWDNTVTLFDVSIQDPKIAQRQIFPHPSAVLDACFAGQSGPQGKIYSGGLDRNVREIDLSTSQQTLLGAHNDAVRCLKWSDQANALLTASWDKTLALFDPRAPPPPTTPWVGLSCPLPGKAYSFDTVGNNVVVAMGNRHVWIYDIRKLGEGLKASSERDARNVEIEPDQKRESSLKFMTRSVRCNPAGDAYATTSIEGRVAVEFFDQSAEVQAKKYAFKCHRAQVDNVDTVYPVNALSFHPIYGTFATGGGDAVISIWDLVAKKRLRQLPKYPASISALDFSKDGTYLAVACAVMEEEGTHNLPGARNCVFVRTVGEECKPKSK